MGIQRLCIFAWVTFWLTCCQSQYDFSKRDRKDIEKEENVTKLLNSTKRMVLLMGVILPPELLKDAECWTTKKADEAELEFYHHLSYQVQVNTTKRGWKTLKFDANYYVGPRNKTPTVVANIFVKGVHMEYASGDYTIHYADDRCFVIGTQEGAPRCGLWVTLKTVDNNHTNCVQAFNVSCGDYGAPVYHVNKRICRFYKPHHTRPRYHTTGTVLTAR